MIRMLLFVLITMVSFSAFGQTLVHTFNLPTSNYWNAAYGLVYHDNSLWISSSSSTDKGVVWGVNPTTGNLLSSFQVNYNGINSSQGLAHDGTNFWYVERKTSRCDLYKVSPTGQVLDSIIISTINGGTSWYLGGAAWDGTGLWVSVYSPDNRAGIYKINTTTKQLVDTIVALQLQPQGVAVKGDTLFYVNDGFQGVDKIYAVSLVTKDTLFTFDTPELPGQRQNPRGLAWDGTYFWLLAEPVGASSGRALFKYDMGGSGSPSISVITGLLDYGNVQIDSSRSSFVQIHNFGNANLIIDSVRSTSNDFVFNVTFPYTIPPGITHQLPITFKPSADKNYVDSVMYFHNDAAVSNSRTRLRGRGIYTSQILGLSSSNVTFGEKRKNSTSYRAVTLSNRGSKPLNVSAITGTSSQYYLENITLPITLDSVGVKDFRVWFKPNQYGLIADTLYFHSNGANGAIVPMVVQGTGATYDSTIGGIMWEAAVPLNPGTSASFKEVDGIIRIKDITGDGVDDIVIMTDNYQVIAYNGNSSGTPDIIWTYFPYNSGYYQKNFKIIEDINNDGYQDVIYGTIGYGHVHAINGKTGEKLWEWGNTQVDGWIEGVDVKRDWNGDGIPDVLVSKSGNESSGQGYFSAMLLNGLNGQLIWRIDQSSQFKLKYAVASTDDGGAIGSRVAGNMQAGELIGFDKVGNIKWVYPTVGAPMSVVEIEDIGGERTTDIIVGTFYGRLSAVSGDNGTELWTKSLGNVIINDTKIISDVDGDGFQDIWTGGIATASYLVSGKTGDIIWQVNTPGNALGKNILGDLTADGFPEVGLTSLDGSLNVYNGKTGSQVYGFRFATGNSNAPDVVAAADDIDKNGTLEFMGGNRGGRLIMFSGGTDIIVGSDLFTIPTEFSLEQNYPNPFNPSTVITYTIPEKGNIRLVVYDLLGRKIKTLVNEEQGRGLYQVEWDGRNEIGNKVTSGVYFYRLESETFLATKKMMMLK
jgi:hypothetical protein